MAVAEWKGRKEGHSHALHGSERGEECMQHRNGKGACRVQGENEESALLTKQG